VTIVSLAPKILLNMAAAINAMCQLNKIWTQCPKWLEIFRTLCLKIRTMSEKINTASCSLQ